MPLYCSDMLKESISIKNFGPLFEVSIEEVKKLNVFIGDSGSGKSTIMKVLVLFQWLFKQLCLRSYLKKAGVQENVREFDFKEYLRNNDILGYLRDDTEIIYTRGKYTISYKNKKLNTRFEIAEEDLSLEKMSYISEKRNLVTDMLVDSIPSSRISNFFLHETFEDFKTALKDLEVMEIPAVNIILEKERLKYGKYELYVKDKGEDTPYKIKIEEASSGMQNVISLYLVIQYFAMRFNMVESAKNTIKRYMFEGDIINQFTPAFNLSDIKGNNIHIHIEEPELSLYPDGQMQLLQGLIDVCYKDNNSRYDISMIISTHSPYIMNYLNLVLKRGELAFEDIAAYLVKDGCVFSLMKPNNRIVDTRSLSEPIEHIYQEFNSQGQSL